MNLLLTINQCLLKLLVWMAFNKSVPLSDRKQKRSCRHPTRPQKTYSSVRLSLIPYWSYLPQNAGLLELTTHLCASSQKAPPTAYTV